MGFHFLHLTVVNQYRHLCLDTPIKLLSGYYTHLFPSKQDSCVILISHVLVVLVAVESGVKANIAESDAARPRSRKTLKDK